MTEYTEQNKCSTVSDEKLSLSINTSQQILSEDTIQYTFQTIHVSHAIIHCIDHDQFKSTDPAMYLDKKLSDNEKMMLLTERWTPRGYCYPVTAGRKYIALWESEYAWLRYLVSMDAAFCAYCLLFGEKVAQASI